MPSPKTAVDDLDDVSVISGGSTISVGSGVVENGYRPTSGHKRSKLSQGKRPKSGKSPYAVKHPPSPRSGQSPKVTTRDMWLTSMRSGSAGLTTQMYQGSNTWTDGRPKHANNSAAVARSNINLFQKTLQPNGKVKNHSRSASVTTAKGPIYKTQEEYYDEVIVLKKSINDLKAENDLLKTKLNRVEGENVLKNRRIDELLNPNQQQEELRRTLTDKKADSSAVVSSLKQKLHNMERTVKDKETELSKLKKDVKSTDINELRIQLEAYHQEVNRLNMVLMDTRAGMLTTNPASTPRTKSSRNERRGGTSASHENRSVEFLKEQNRQLQLDNQSLRKDLVAAVNGGPKGKLANEGADYADMNRVQLLQTIHRLEENLQQTEEKIKLKPSGKDKVDNDNVKDGKRRDKDLGTLKLSGSPSERIQQLQEREKELMDEIEKQKNTIEKLKEDRTHYRKVADELRQQLENTEKELETKSKESERKQSLTRHSSLKEKEIPKEKQQNEENAALVLQKNWRKHRQWKSSKLQEEDEKRRNDEEEYDQAVVDIQAALRAHTTRQKRLEREEDRGEDISQDDAVVMIQAAARGHLVRKRHYDQLLDAENKQLEESRYEEPRRSKREGMEISGDNFRLGRSAISDESKIIRKEQDRFTPLESQTSVTRRPGVRQSSLSSYKDESVVTTSQKKSYVSVDQEESFSRSRRMSKDTDSDENVVVMPSKKLNSKSSNQAGLYSRMTTRVGSKEINKDDDDDDDDDDSDDDVVITPSKRSGTNMVKKASIEKRDDIKKRGDLENRDKFKNSKSISRIQQNEVESDEDVVVSAGNKGKKLSDSPSRRTSKNVIKTNSSKNTSKNITKGTAKKSGFEIAESDSDEGVVMNTPKNKERAARKDDNKNKGKTKVRNMTRQKPLVVDESESEEDDNVITSSKRPISVRRGSGLKSASNSSGIPKKSSMDDLFSSTKRPSKSRVLDESDDEEDEDYGIGTKKKSERKKDSGFGATSMWGQKGNSKKSSGSSSSPFGAPKRSGFYRNQQSDDEDDVISPSRGRKASALDELF